MSTVGTADARSHPVTQNSGFETHISRISFSGTQDSRFKTDISHIWIFGENVPTGKDGVEFLTYCPFGPESQVNVEGRIEGIECTIQPEALLRPMPQAPFMSEWRLDAGWAEMLMIGHLSFLRAYFDLLIPQEGIDSLLYECSRFEVVSISN